MKRHFASRCFELLLCTLLACSPNHATSNGGFTPDGSPVDGGWRSELFPRGWRPIHAGGRPTSDGRFLHDFAFAGYHRGDAPPVGAGNVTRALSAADFGDGASDATSAIQSAIDEACAAGGGVVLLSRGTFRVSFPAAVGAPALRIACSRLVVRGAGSDAAGTRLLLDAGVARQRAMILVKPRAYNGRTGSATRPERHLVNDLLLPTRTLPLDAVDGFAVGDHIAIRTDLTDAFRAEHHMAATSTGAGDLWPAATPASAGLTYLRRITAIDVAAKTITVDAPTRHALTTHDNARAFKTTGYIDEIGLEGFAIGMREHPTSAAGTNPGPLGDEADGAYDTTGTAAYDVHASSAIRVEGTRDAWISGVATYAPPMNTSGAHILSIGLWLDDSSQRVTVQSCAIERPQYRGGGGNGYAFLVQGADHLIVDSRGARARHDFIVGSFSASGNVFLRSRTESPRYSDDTHRFLSHANLYDAMVLDAAWLQSVNRGAESSGAGFTATEDVYWNTEILANHRTTVNAPAGFPAGVAIETAQWGWGYAIGTRAALGASADVSTKSYTNSGWAKLDPGLPRDFVEGAGKGATLEPPSLYVEQLRLRGARGE